MDFNGRFGCWGKSAFLIIKGPGEEKNRDGWIATKVKTTLMFHRNVNAYYTQVTIVDGVVRVVNQMSVGQNKSEKPKEPIRETIDDASITAQIKVALLYHGSTSGLSTGVTTNNGEVMLTGTAKNSAEKDLVSKVAADIHGVKKIDNKMAIAPKT